MLKAFLSSCMLPCKGSESRIAQNMKADNMKNMNRMVWSYRLYWEKWRLPWHSWSMEYDCDQISVCTYISSCRPQSLEVPMPDLQEAHCPYTHEVLSTLRKRPASLDDPYGHLARMLFTRGWPDCGIHDHIPTCSGWAIWLVGLKVVEVYPPRGRSWDHG
jgi:hypothetical protein